MAHLFAMEARKEEVAKHYFELTQAASDALPSEVKAVTKIQSYHRATQIRVVYHEVVAAAQLIQRMVRGCLGRRRAQAVNLQRNNWLRQHFFHHCARTIQKRFRGYRSRSCIHDFYGRKLYLEKVEKRGEWTKDYLAAEHKEKLAAAKVSEELKVREEFQHLAGDLHHLMSTRTIPGVYNPPYSDLLPRAFEKPIEEHLREACVAKMPASLKRTRHRSARAQGSARFGASQAEASFLEEVRPPQEIAEKAPCFSRAASSGRLRKIQGPFRSREQIEVANVKAAQLYGTIQATGPYDALEHDQRMQARISKLVRSSNLDFRAAGNKEKATPSSVHVGMPFNDRPVELRGDYVELPKIRDKPPFFTAHGGGKQFGEYHEQPLLAHGHV
ncbi:unnamed protein product [Effrenium voratum]|nr:unnamed protein product [Effrenium voratum]|mmetsp:Transcript_30634/g.72986  ORF Transcript_30634/g.72986 Transcript_30634/m.72986 type:complete len:386 (-) Transcript_30634:74-1231(-)